MFKLIRKFFYTLTIIIFSGCESKIVKAHESNEDSRTTFNDFSYFIIAIKNESQNGFEIYRTGGIDAQQDRAIEIFKKLDLSLYEEESNDGDGILIIGHFGLHLENGRSSLMKVIPIINGQIEFDGIQGINYLTVDEFIQNFE